MGYPKAGVTALPAAGISTDRCDSGETVARWVMRRVVRLHGEIAEPDVEQYLADRVAARGPTRRLVGADIPRNSAEPQFTGSPSPTVSR